MKFDILEGDMDRGIVKKNQEAEDLDPIKRR
jgi:hypothetical protein